MRRLALAALALAAACTGPTGAAASARSPSAPPPAAPAPAAVAPSPTPRPPGTFTIAAAGDLLAHQAVVADARTAQGGYDFRPLLAPIRRDVAAADLAICHLETPLAAADRDVHYYPDFAAPPELVSAIRWAGFDTCTTASNHTLDQGLAGVRRTLAALDAAGLRHVGAARHPGEERATYDVRGVRVAHLDYTYGLNGRSVPAAAPWTVHLIDVPRILADARAARAAGARFVIVGLHWGQEYSSPATAEQRRIARALLRSPYVDLLLGCHAHVVQPVERINGKYVVYGMGNLLAHHAPCCNTPPTRDGMIARVTVAPRGERYVVTRLGYTPTYVDQRSSRVEPALPGSASWRRTVARVDLLDAQRYGVAPVPG